MSRPAGLIWTRCTTAPRQPSTILRPGQKGTVTVSPVVLSADELLDATLSEVLGRGACARSPAGNEAAAP